MSGNISSQAASPNQSSNKPSFQPTNIFSNTGNKKIQPPLPKPSTQIFTKGIFNPSSSSANPPLPSVSNKNKEPQEQFGLGYKDNASLAGMSSAADKGRNQPYPKAQLLASNSALKILPQKPQLYSVKLNVCNSCNLALKLGCEGCSRKRQKEVQQKQQLQLSQKIEIIQANSAKIDKLSTQIAQAQHVKQEIQKLKIDNIKLRQNLQQGEQLLKEKQSMLQVLLLELQKQKENAQKYQRILSEPKNCRLIDHNQNLWKPAFRKCQAIKPYLRLIDQLLPQRAPQLKQCINTFELQLIQMVQKQLDLLPNKINQILQNLELQIQKQKKLIMQMQKKMEETIGNQKRQFLRNQSAFPNQLVMRMLEPLDANTKKIDQILTRVGQLITATFNLFVDIGYDQQPPSDHQIQNSQIMTEEIEIQKEQNQQTQLVLKEDQGPQLEGKKPKKKKNKKKR